MSSEIQDSTANTDLNATNEDNNDENNAAMEAVIRRFHALDIDEPTLEEQLRPRLRGRTRSRRARARARRRRGPSFSQMTRDYYAEYYRHCCQLIVDALQRM